MLLSTTPSRIISRYLSTLPTSLQWRTRIHRSRLVAHVATILLQRKRWIPLLLHLKPDLLAGFAADPNLFFQVLSRTASHPHIAFDFFTWSESAMGLRPDLRSRFKMVQILVDSGLLMPAKALLGPILSSQPALPVLDAVSCVCGRGDFSVGVFCLLLEEYARSGRVLDGLEAFRRIRVYGFPPTSRCCHVLFDRLIWSGEIKIARCFYAAVVRAGVVADSRMWVLLVRLLCREGKLDRAVGLLESGVFHEKACSLVIECYSRNGDFGAAIGLLKTMYEKDLRPGFGVYSTILDGGCRYQDDDVVGSCLRDMFVKGLLSTVPLFYYDLVIQRLCELGRTYAAEMFVKRARRAKVSLGNGTYVCVLRALSKAGRVKEAMGMYQIISERGISVNPSCLDVFLSAVCKGDPSEEGSRVLKDAFGKGFVPSGSDISKYIASQCSRGWWEEAENLLNLVLEKGIRPDIICCTSLVRHYCKSNVVDSAIMLLNKLKKLRGDLDLTSYNELLDALTIERRLVDAIQVFDYMREQNVRDHTSFIIMITALCREKELRKAMNLHDEMLKVRLKPDEDTYKRLISGFG